MELVDMVKWLWVAILILVFAVGTWVIIEQKRKGYRKAVEGKILCEFLSSTNVGYTELCPYVGNILTQPAKGDRPAREYQIPEGASFLSKYPNEGFMARFGTTVKKIHFVDDVIIPSFGSKNYQEIKDLLSISASMLFHMRNEKASGLAMQASKVQQELEDKLQQVIDPRIIYMLVGVGTGASLFGAYMGYKVLIAVGASL